MGDLGFFTGPTGAQFEPNSQAPHQFDPNVAQCSAANGKHAHAQHGGPAMAVCLYVVNGGNSACPAPIFKAG